MRLRVLGPIEAGDAAGLGPRDRVVLAALAVHPGDALNADVLADALWGERPPVSASKVVQGCVSRLRRVLGADAISTTSAGYRLTLTDSDRDEFEELAARGREFLATGTPERAVAAFRSALDLWAGPPFVELEEWMPGRLEASRLGELRLAVQEDLLRARLDCGDHAAVAAEGMVLVGEEPWRERRWSLLALAQYRCGRQAEALATIRTARRALGRQLGLDPGSELVDLERAILEQDPALAAEHAARASSRCPWRGLASYDAEDSETFFGRSADVAACLRRLEESPLLALAGPSGSGKSSLLKAGLVPSLRRRRGGVVTFTPGIDPATALAAARATTPGDPVLCVDQFEELFTGGLDAAARRSFLRELAAYAADRAPVLLTVRSDYLSELAVEAAFASLVERGLHLVAPLDEERLRETIEGPARVAGLRLEHGLVDLLLRDAKDQPGALPLLSHALAETWQRREDSLLTVDGYRASGGISGAVAASADRLCASLNEEGRVQLRWLMLRMGSLADHGEPVRTPLPRQLTADEPERARVLDLLVRARLVTSADGRFELAHESLIRAWPQLRNWLEEDRVGQRLWRHLAAAAVEWDRLGRPASELYQGVRLEAALTWAGRVGSQPTPLERDFLDASAAHADAERRALTEQTRRQRIQNRRLRSLLGGVVALLAVSLVAAVLAVDQSNSAAEQRDSARTSREAAVHESMVARSLSLRPAKRDIAALLAVEAFRRQPDALAEAALIGTFTEAPGFMGYREVPYQMVYGAAIPGTRKIVMGSGPELHVVDLDSGRTGPAFEHPISTDLSMMSELAVSADGRRVAQLMFDPRTAVDCGTYERLKRDDGRGCTLLTVFDLRTRKPVLGPVATPISGGDLAIDGDGRLVAVAGGFDGDLVTYDVDSGRLLGQLPAARPRPQDAYNIRDTAAVAFGPRHEVYVAPLAGPLQLVDARSLEVRRTIPGPSFYAHNFLEVTSDDDMVVGTGDRGMVALDARTGRRLWTVRLDEEHQRILWPCYSFTLSEAAGRFYCGSIYGSIEERELATGERTGRLFDTQRGETGDLVVAGGNELVELGEGHYLRWRLDGSGPIARLVAPGAMSVAGYDPGGRWVATVPRGSYRPHRVIDPSTARTLMRSSVQGSPLWVGSGTLLVTPNEPGATFVDVASGRRWRARDPRVTEAWDVFTDPDERHAWALQPSRNIKTAHGMSTEFDVLEFDIGTAKPTGRKITVPGYPDIVKPSAQDDTVWVNYVHEFAGAHLTNERHKNFVGSRFDVSTGRHGEEVELAYSTVYDGDRRRLVGTDFLGNIRELDAESERPLAALPGSRGAIWNMAFSADGKRFLASGVDGFVNVYDTEGWTRLAVIGADPVSDVPEGFLRPDGGAVLVNNRLGVTEWTLDPERAAAAACRLAGRNLTRLEWTTYMGDTPYRRTCAAYPAGE
jgi:DNA-binding SARP family transcriptional activator